MISSRSSRPQCLLYLHLTPPLLESRHSRLFVSGQLARVPLGQTEIHSVDPRLESLLGFSERDLIDRSLVSRVSHRLVVVACRSVGKRPRVPVARRFVIFEIGVQLGVGADGLHGDGSFLHGERIVRGRALSARVASRGVPVGVAPTLGRAVHHRGRSAAVVSGRSVAGFVDAVHRGAAAAAADRLGPGQGRRPVLGLHSAELVQALRGARRRLSLPRVVLSTSGA